MIVTGGVDLIKSGGDSWKMSQFDYMGIYSSPSGVAKWTPPMYDEPPGEK